jgi:hypothetical protein
MIALCLVCGIAGIWLGFVIKVVADHLERSGDHLEEKHQPRPPRHGESRMLAGWGAYKGGELFGWYTDNECWIEDHHYTREK